MQAWRSRDGVHLTCTNSKGIVNLKNFSVFNDLQASFPEDNISLFKTKDFILEDGLCDGNNSSSGCAFLIEDSPAGNVTIRNCHASKQSNGCFCPADTAHDVSFIDCYAESMYYNHALCGRSASGSNGLIAGGVGSPVRIVVKNLAINADSSGKNFYLNAPKQPAQLKWPNSAFSSFSSSFKKLTLRPEVALVMPWE